MADQSRLTCLFHRLSILIFLLLFIYGHSFGVSPQNFYKGDIMEVKASKLASTKTNIPNSYYSVPYCRPYKIVETAQNFEDIFRCDGIQNTPYETTNEEYYINNHLSFVVKFHQNLETASARVVGFEVEAFSVNHKYDNEWSYKKLLTTCDQRAKRSVTGFDPPQEVDDQKEIIFTYDVEFRETNVKWASTWDTYLLTTDDDQIQWFSLVNSLMIVLSISGMVAMIMLRTLHRDIFEYDQLESLEEAQEQTGWKVIHTDVFRPPVNAELLCVLVGTGVQLFATILMTIIFIVSGIFSPPNLGDLMAVLMIIWALMGMFGGSAMARLVYKTFEASEWNMKAALATAFMFPGTVFCILIVLYSLTSDGEPWGAVLCDSMLVMLFLWLAISAPLVFMGSYICFIGPEAEEAVKTSKIPREIPEQSWYMRPSFTIMVGGMLPFGAVFNELFLMLTSSDLHQFYYMFGLVFVVLIITCAEVTIVLCYFQLCREDYRWWWRSYLTAGSSAFYFFIYATFCFFTKPNITVLVPGVFYFGYAMIASFALFLLTGTIGFYACLWFIRRIYSSLALV